MDALFSILPGASSKKIRGSSLLPLFGLVFLVQLMASRLEFQALVVLGTTKIEAASI